MARMIPNTMQDDNDSYGEKQVFEALRTKLGPDYVVFHSVRWNDIYSAKRTIWGESDFTIFHPQKGIIVIEVKSGGVEFDGNSWTYVRTDNHKRYSMKNPLKQADKNKYRFVELLEDLFEENECSPKIKCQTEPAVWFPSVSSRTDVGNMPMEYHEEIVLLENALDDPETFIDNIYKFYNQFLRKALQEEKELNPQKYENIDFYNIHQLVSTKIKAANVDDDDIEVFLNKYDQYDWEYKHIIVDEAQDFKDIFIEKLYEIAFYSEGSFYVFFDKNQFVQGKEYPKWLKNAECRLVLNINCRNTYRIAEASGKPIGVEPKMMKSVKGDNANLYICGDRKAVEKKIVSLIAMYHENKYPLDEICIISAKTVENSILSGATKLGCYELTEDRQKGKVLFTSSRKFKGLESDAIILVDIDETTFENDENKRLFYVGSSRAKLNLDLIVNGDESTIATIVDQLDFEPKKKPIVAIVKALDLKYNPEK